MAFSDINQDFETEMRSSAQTYENTSDTKRKLDSKESKDKDQIYNGDGHYDQLNVKSMIDERKKNQMETLLNRLKVMTYLNLVMLVVLYLTVIPLTVFLAVRKVPVDGSWTPWSPWSLFDGNCHDGIQTRHRTCTNPPPLGGGDGCIGSETETKVFNSTSSIVSDVDTKCGDTYPLSYSYFDEIAQSYCFSRHSPGYAFAIRRDCEGVAPTCVDICAEAAENMLQYINYQKQSVSCFDALYIYKDHPHLRANPSTRQPDAGKVNIGTYGYGEAGCRYTPNACGPNYCCCKAY